MGQRSKRRVKQRAKSHATLVKRARRRRLRRNRKSANGNGRRSKK
jgi:hypothetical protein